MDKTIMIVFGTRPEFLKIKPIIEELEKRNKNYVTVFTSQHKDIVPSEFPVTLRLPEPAFSNNRLSSILSYAIFDLSEVLAANPQITHVLVQGDTTSALAGALAAMNSRVELIHLEAGLRTYDFENPFPEEYNRQLISKVAKIHLCPTFENSKNLRDENVDGITFVVGNTILDSLVKYKHKVKTTNKILATLHRRENHDNIDLWFNEINKLAVDYPDYKFIVPLHPNPNVQMHKDILTHVNVINPLSHEDFINELVETAMVISDSGGIQEECSFFRKKVIVCRKVTERPESVNSTSIMCSDPEKLSKLFADNIKKPISHNVVCPYGDGTSAKQIVDIFEKVIYNR